MSGFDRMIAGRCRKSVLAVACLPAILMLAACSDLRQALGMDRTGPDEFAVESRAPLTIPPDFDLRPPQPGAHRPQEVTAAEKAQKVIDQAGPGEPGKQASFALKPNEGTGLPPNPDQSVAENSLASKLLSSADSASGGTVESRETSTLKGVH